MSIELCTHILNNICITLFFNIYITRGFMKRCHLHIVEVVYVFTITKLMLRFL